MRVFIPKALNDSSHDWLTHFYILLIAGGVKAFLGSWTPALVIWGVTIINALIGYVQEAKAEDAIASLAKTVTTETTVLRDGQRLRIPSVSTTKISQPDWSFWAFKG